MKLEELSPVNISPRHKISSELTSYTEDTARPTSNSARRAPTTHPSPCVWCHSERMAEEFSEETKDEARQFMRGLVGSAPESENDFTGGDGINMSTWRMTYAEYTLSKNDSTSVMEQFWSMYDPSQSSIWTMTYDEADSNENLNDTIAISTEFMKKTQSIKEHCFGIMHTLDNLEVEGLWIFNDADPERLFGVNDDTSWFSWSQLGPEANEYVRQAVEEFLIGKDKLKGRTIKHTELLG